MKTLPEQHWETIDFDGDIRWELVQRVIDSPHLISSARLRDFLLHVTACAIRETPEEATEQQIGIQVFQRSPGFNSSEDSIVRSQARVRAAGSDHRKPGEHDPQTKARCVSHGDPWNCNLSLSQHRCQGVAAARRMNAGARGFPANCPHHIDPSATSAG